MCALLACATLRVWLWPDVNNNNSSSSSSININRNISGGGGMAAKGLVSVEFVVHGTVQGVFFRKFTKQEADRLGLVGYVEVFNYQEG